MSDLTFRISPALRNRIIGKMLLVALLSALMGYAFAAEFAADHARGAALTLKQYTADFDAYRAELMEAGQWSGWGWTMLSFMMLGSAILTYELLATAFAWAVGKGWGAHAVDTEPAP